MIIFLADQGMSGFSWRQPTDILYLKKRSLRKVYLDPPKCLFFGKFSFGLAYLKDSLRYFISLDITHNLTSFFLKKDFN